MTITIPVLDFLFSTFICFLSATLFYQGWHICFKDRKSPLFIYSIILSIVSLFDKENSYHDWIISKLSPAIIKTQGLFALIGGFLGFLGGALFFVDTLTKVYIN